MFEVSMPLTRTPAPMLDLRPSKDVPKSPGPRAARACGAVCTLDFFGFDRERALRYRGRLDASGREPPGRGTRRELHEPMLPIARAGVGPGEPHASIGCSIKWRAP